MKRAFAGFALLLTCTFAAVAQTTAFNYQGSLNSGGTPANGNHDFEFALFDSLAGGTQLGSTLTRGNVVVTNGVFSVSLDFGNQFPGATRFLEIRVRPSGGGAFTPLAPRQAANSSPYSIRSLNAETAANAANATNATNATQLGGVAANQYVLTSDIRLSDPRPPTAGSENYIQNQSAVEQPGNFNISGDGTVGGTLSTFTISAFRFNRGTTRVLDFNSTDSVSVGIGAGTVNFGSDNTFVGGNAGNANPGTAFNNAFFGTSSGMLNTQDDNSFFGSNSGLNSTTGSGNSFFGRSAGNNNTAGSLNSAFGAFAHFGSGVLNNATAIGARARVSQSNSLVLGSILNVNGCTPEISCDSVNVGIGTTAPARRLHVANGTSGAVSISSSDFVIEDNSSAFQHFLTPDDIESGILFGDATDSIAGGLIFNNAATNNGIQFRSGGNTTRMTLTGSGNLGIGTATPDDKLDVAGSIRVSVLGVAGPTPLCRNASNQISLCSSSGRYKSNINPFSSGLSLVRQLRPVSFNWREGGMLDLGLAAEDVAKVEPLLTTTNDKGEIEGVKYDRVGVVLVNAVQEQQAQIEAQQKEIESLKATIKTFQSALCEAKPQVSVCKGEPK